MFYGLNPSTSLDAVPSRRRWTGMGGNLGSLQPALTALSTYTDKKYRQYFVTGFSIASLSLEGHRTTAQNLDTQDACPWG
jgi:hypothetical protein